MRGSSFVQAGLLLVWIAAVGAGYTELIRHDYAVAAHPERVLPLSSLGIAPSAGAPTLVLFVHPQCPCSQASLKAVQSLRELPAGAKMPIYIYFYVPQAQDPEWVSGANWDLAAGISGAHVIRDVDGALAKQCGVVTSGTALVYDGAGARVFAGGLTASRGHEGPSAGLDAVEAIAEGRTPARSATPAFGCLLFDPADGNA